MKKIFIALFCTALLSSCSGLTGLTGASTTGSTSNVARPAAATNSTTSATTTSTTTASTTASTTTASTSSNTSSNSSSALASILGAATSNSSGGVTSLLGSVIGSFLGTTNANTIIGTWTYKEPSIQFDSSNLLAQAGGAVASQTVVNKIQPYYEKLGIKAGIAKITLNQDNTCKISLSNKTISGTYTYDSTQGTITVKGSTGIKIFTAYASVSLSQLALTLDTTNLLNMLKSFGSSSSNTTLSSISGLASSFNGMKTGFLFTK